MQSSSGTNGVPFLILNVLKQIQKFSIAYYSKKKHLKIEQSEHNTQNKSLVNV